MPPLESKNHATSGDKNNHATFQDKKITLSLGPIAYKLVNKALNCSKLHQICPQWSKEVRIGPNRSKLVQTFPKGTKWVQMGLLGINRSKWVKMGL